MTPKGIELIVLFDHTYWINSWFHLPSKTEARALPFHGCQDSDLKTRDRSSICACLSPEPAAHWAPESRFLTQRDFCAVTRTLHSPMGALPRLQGELFFTSQAGSWMYLTDDPLSDSTFQPYIFMTLVVIYRWSQQSFCKRSTPLPPSELPNDVNLFIFLSKFTQASFISKHW